ncbi:adenosylcobinamide-phosphate synthase CbiB [Sulfitobacter sp. D35]|uniref:adenosylcobinamide-phosphate synthase CbiB n=1 Tax=Sulfitobacter sp. D35 TaxID=3083252 RepID=UPI00296F1A29|nr:adenosylcobinamide-phosphate synthase CbiB [Sulfitobacter sp. D35]MDW4497316.1 adenosylcobinamide-phosphate synthase CbiB [Sulfitobacter sp. D35]
MSTAAMLACALALDALLGEPKWLWSRLPHPAVLLGRAVGALDRALNRGSLRRTKGLATLVLLVVSAWITGSLVSALGPWAVVPAAAILLAQRSLVEHVAAVADGLRMSLIEGRRAVARIVSRDTGGMEEPQVARSAIESAAENLSDGVIAPAFWFLVGGLPAMLVYKAVNTADSMIGYRTPRHADFGWAAARFDDLMNLAPARLTAMLVVLVGRVSDRHGIRADAARHKSPNAGWPEAAFARALGIALAGPRAYDGHMRDFPFVNPDGRLDIGPSDIDAAVRLLWTTWGAALAIPVGIALLT